MAPPRALSDVFSLGLTASLPTNPILLRALSLLFFLCCQAQAASLGLRESIDFALAHNGELRAQRFQIQQAEQDVGRVSAEFGPHFEALAGIGPITRATGNATEANEDKNTFGRTILGKISVTQPLYAWGRRTNYKNAAHAGVHVEQAEVQQKEDEVRFQVKEAYFGFQLANSLRDFIQSGKEELLKTLNSRKKKGAKEDYRLQIFLSEVEAREAEVKKYYELAKEGYTLRLGAERGTLPKDEWLAAETRNKKPVEEYIAVAQASRPEFRQIGEGIFAKRSLAKAEKKGAYPVLAFMASYDLADTNVRTPQPGVFSYDPYNRETWALGVGFKLDLQWDLQANKAAKLRAEADELEAKEGFARRGIEVEVRRSYLELEEAETRLQAATTAYQTGKKWLTGELMSYGSGLGNASGIVEAYGARAETTKAYFEAVHRHHMAWAMLSRVVGREVDPLLAP